MNQIAGASTTERGKMKMEFKTRKCKVILSQDELKEQANIMATSAQKLEDIESDKKSANASFKEKLERVSVDIRTAARLYKDGYDYRDVECAVIKDWEYGEILYVRADTCELAHVESMTQAERQRHIDDVIREEEERIQIEAGEGLAKTGFSDDEIAGLNTDIHQRNVQREMSAERSIL